MPEVAQIASMTFVQLGRQEKISNIINWKYVLGDRFSEHN
ncbi:hypothetical protein APA_2602 [Pseudanabaena sp. lw0831]|nr:hypothetical protein APA_2602 [Pseudanabaena sp. lw0831]